VRVKALKRLKEQAALEQMLAELCSPVADSTRARTCLAKNPAQRPSTANDLYGAFQRIGA
jgi:hypothetical protein